MQREFEALRVNVHRFDFADKMSISCRHCVDNASWSFLVAAMAMVARGGAPSAVFAHLVAAGTLRPDTTAAMRKTIVRTVVATGPVLPPAKVEIASRHRSTVRRIAALEGARVNRGALLLELDAEEAEVEQKEAAATRASAEATLAQLQGRSEAAMQLVDRTGVEPQTARAAFDRADSLWRQGVIARTERELAESQLAAATQQFQAARLSASDLAAQGMEAKRLRAELDAAEARLAAARLRRRQLSVAAPASGVILQRNVEVGQVVDPGEVLLVLAADGETRLVIEPDERALSFLAVGQQAWASAESFPDHRFSAMVTWIAPSIHPARGTVEVRLGVPEPPAYLRADMTVAVTVQAGERHGALVIPAESVQRTDGTAWVEVWNEGRRERRTIRVGGQFGSDIEVLDGLHEGHRVVLRELAPQAGGVHPWND